MKHIRKIIQTIKDPEMDFDERVFILFTIMTELAVLLVFLGDLFVKEHMFECIVLGSTLVLNPLLVYVCLKTRRLDVGSVIISLMVVFGILPVVFFFGGGPDGGAVLWFAYSAIYIGMLLKGRIRSCMLCLLFFTAILDYVLAWLHPELVRPHTKAVYYFDSAASVLVVSFFAYSMIMFLNQLYIAENARAKMEYERAEQLNRAQNAFFSNMSHEIRTPINTILGLNEMILREAVADEVVEDATNIQSAGKLLLALINDILDRSKLDSGQMRLVNEAYGTKEMLLETISMLAPRAKEKGLEFEADIQQDLPARLIGDEVRIKQILINVLNNAIKYTKDGKVSLAASVSERSGDTVRILFSVRDTGIGIKKENLPYLFRAFRRVDGSETHHIEGTGLGLSIVKELLSIMGGKITVDSVYTKGSTFVIEIPQRVSDRTPIGDIREAFTGKAGLKTRGQPGFQAPDAKILAVDDNEMNLMVAKKLLRDTGIQVETAGSGTEALQKTLAAEYHIILMDHLMPDMDGIECAKEIRMQKGGRCRESKIIALTANAGSENRKLFAHAGFDGYLTKPVSGKDLEAEIQRLLPEDVVTSTGEAADIAEHAVQWMSTTHKKRAVAITTESVADLPEELIEAYDIAILPHRVQTREGKFLDGLEVDAKGLLAYMEETGSMVKSQPPDVREHEDFFARALTLADTVLHITTSGFIKNSGYPAAVEAAASFDHVFIYDSHHLSCGQGILAIQAANLAKEGHEAREIMQMLEQASAKIHTSFIVDGLYHLGKAGQVSRRLSHILDPLMIRPVLAMKGGRMKLSAVYMGSKEVAWDSYLHSKARKIGYADPGLLFIPYAGLSHAQLEQIRKKLEAATGFTQIHFVQASPAISANCGPGTFGLIYTDR